MALEDERESSRATFPNLSRDPSLPETKKHMETAGLFMNSTPGRFASLQELSLEPLGPPLSPHKAQTSGQKAPNF